MQNDEEKQAIGLDLHPIGTGYLERLEVIWHGSCHPEPNRPIWDKRVACREVLSFSEQSLLRLFPNGLRYPHRPGKAQMQVTGEP